jgi:aspartyl aminopeptidase
VETDRHIEQLGDFVVASPSPFHAVAESARLLRAAGFHQLAEEDRWSDASGGCFVVRDGTLVAWWQPADASGTTSFRVVGAHTDFPTFKLKPKPTTGTAGWLQAGVEVYGAPLLTSWLDRELALAGRLVTRSGESVLVQTGPLLRIPQLAIHLDRAVNGDGVKLDPQRQTAPIWGLGDPTTADLVGYLADLGGVADADILGYDVVAVDTQQPAVFGGEAEFFAAGRLDNLSSVHAGLRALLAIADDPPGDAIAVLAAFDHEEVGSASASGAAGPVLEDVMRRISESLGAEADDAARARAGSVCVSADAGHAVHPNYPDRHDPANRPIVNAGPLLKINASQRYATDAVGAALWMRACETAGVPTQEFVSNNAIPCGSTIGPITATRTGIRTIDVGTPLLSMHSAREMCGVRDPGYLAAAIHAFYGIPRSYSS